MTILTDNPKTTGILLNTAKDYEFAELSTDEITQLNQVQKQLSQNQNKEVILLAYTKK
ncbi:MAG: hypothetical protein ACM3X9_01810 [Bacillota bacterium]